MEWSLSDVDLSVNKLSGALPESWGGVQNLYLANSSFTSSIPAAWGSSNIL